MPKPGLSCSVSVWRIRKFGLRTIDRRPAPARYALPADRSGSPHQDCASVRKEERRINDDSSTAILAAEAIIGSECGGTTSRGAADSHSWRC